MYPENQCMPAFLPPLPNEYNGFMSEHFRNASTSAQARASLVELVYSFFLYQTQQLLVSKGEMMELEWCQVLSESINECYRSYPQCQSANLILPCIPTQACKQAPSTHILPLLEHDAPQRQVAVHDNLHQDVAGMPGLYSGTFQKDSIVSLLNWYCSHDKVSSVIPAFSKEHMGQ